MFTKVSVGSNIITNDDYVLVSLIIDSNLLWLLILGLVVQGLFLSCIVGVFGEMNRITTRMGMPDDIATQGIVSGVFSSSFSIGSALQTYKYCLMFIPAIRGEEHNWRERTFLFLKFSSSHIDLTRSKQFWIKLRLSPSLSSSSY